VNQKPRDATKDTSKSKKAAVEKSKEIERAGDLLDTMQSGIEKTQQAADAKNKGGLFGLFGR
jgi:hypothetical protein